MSIRRSSRALLTLPQVYKRLFKLTHYFDRVGGPVDRERRLAEAPVVWTEAVDAPTTPAAGRFHLAKRQTDGQMALALGHVAIRGRHVRSVSVRRGD